MNNENGIYLDTADTFEPLIFKGGGRFSLPKTKALNGLRDSDGKKHPVTIIQTKNG